MDRLVEKIRCLRYAPFTFFVTEGHYQHVQSLRVGECTWLIYRGQFESRGVIFVAAHSSSANSGIQKFDVPALLRGHPAT